MRPTQHWLLLGMFLGSLAAENRLFANPVVGEDVSPPHAIVGEHVLVGIGRNGAVVAGTYRLRVTPHTKRWSSRPYLLALNLPVPVPASIRDAKRATAAVRPVLTCKGARYEPTWHSFREFPGPPGVARLAVFRFWIRRGDLPDEFEVTIQYEQPVIAHDQKELVFYMPSLPLFARYKKSMRLREESFLVTFESADGSTLRLAWPVRKPIRNEPRAISVRPHHLEVIAVERLSGSDQPAGPSGAPDDEEQENQN